MPNPLSFISIRAIPGSSASTSNFNWMTGGSSPRYLIALEMRFCRSWQSKSRSPFTRGMGWGSIWIVAPQFADVEVEAFLNNLHHWVEVDVRGVELPAYPGVFQQGVNQVGHVFPGLFDFLHGGDHFLFVLAINRHLEEE